MSPPTERELSRRLASIETDGVPTTAEEWVAKRVSEYPETDGPPSGAVPIARFENEHYRIDVCSSLADIPKWIDVTSDLPVPVPADPD